MNYMFGYGSIMNKTSLAKTIADPSDAIPAELQGYQRKCNALCLEVRDGHSYLYMNIVPNESMSVHGMLVPVTDEELTLMKEREAEYTAVNVTSQISPAIEGEIVAFVAPDAPRPDYKIPRSYLDTCTRDMDEVEREQWIADTIIENEVVEDLDDPIYENAAF